MNVIVGRLGDAVLAALVAQLQAETSTSPLPVTDAANAAFQGVVLLTPGTAATALRSVGYVITAAGTVSFTLADGSSITLSLPASAQLQMLPFAVTEVVLGTGTAGTFWNLK